MDWGVFELDPEYLWLYLVATALSTIGCIILFRESRARKRAMREAQEAFEKEKAAEEAAKAERSKAKKKRRH